MIARLNKEWHGKLGLDKVAKVTLIVILIDVAIVLGFVGLALST